MAVFGLCLLAVSVQAQDLFGGPPEPGQMPSRFVKIDGVDAGYALFAHGVPPVSIRLGRATCVLGKVRAGFALMETWWSLDEWTSDVMLPVHFGYTIWSKPKHTWLFYGALPEVYAEVSGSLWNTGTRSDQWFKYEPSFRASACCEADYYGVGVRLETGVLNIDTETQYSWVPSRRWFPYVGFHVRLLTFGIGF
jgi:hypothetical protein